MASLADAPLCGLPDLDAANALRPGALTLLDASSTAEVIYAWMADAAVTGRTVLVADGGNFLDVYRLATAARRRAAARFPDAPRSDLAAHEEMALDRVRLARGFTAHQLHTIVEDLLPLEAKAGTEGLGERWAEGGRRKDEGNDPSPSSFDLPSVPALSLGLIVVPGLLDMYLDDELSREESRALVGRALSTLRRLAGRCHVPVLVVNWMLSPTSDHPLRVLLDESVDEHVILKPAPRGGTAIVLPRRGAMFLSPGPGTTRIEDYLEPEDARGTPVAPILARKPGPWRSNGNRMYGKFGEAHRRSDWAVHEGRERIQEVG